MKEPQIKARVSRAVCSTTKQNRRLKDTDTLLGDLGFDSLRIATLAIALEEEFERPLLLIDWISTVADPAHLTVGSLCEHIGAQLARDEQR